MTTDASIEELERALERQLGYQWSDCTEAWVEPAVAAERERIKAVLLAKHEHDKHMHNYWKYLSVMFFGD